MWIDIVNWPCGWGGILLTEECIVPCSNEWMIVSFLCHTVWEDRILCHKKKKTSTRYCLRWRIRSARSPELFQVQVARAHSCPWKPSCSSFDSFSLEGGSSKRHVWINRCSVIEESLAVRCHRGGRKPLLHWNVRCAPDRWPYDLSWPDILFVFHFIRLTTRIPCVQLIHREFAIQRRGLGLQCFLRAWDGSLHELVLSFLAWFPPPPPAQGGNWSCFSPVCNIPL